MYIGHTLRYKKCILTHSKVYVGHTLRFKNVLVCIHSGQIVPEIELYWSKGLRGFFPPDLGFLV